MSNTTVHVKNIAAATEDKEIKDFFSFCGKITDIQVTPAGETKDAAVTFEKETAAKTAILLNNTQLGTSHITVASASGDSNDDGSHFKDNANRDTDEITQEEKPRSRILAEYLAQGYVVGDAALQRAIELDTQHGVSSRFFGTLQNLDQKYHATDRAKATDQSYGITARAQGLFGGLSSYFEKATSSPTGKRIVTFYQDGSRQVQDIHTEARRLADLKKEQHGGSAYKASGLERFLGKEKEKAVPPATGETIGTQAPTQPDPTTAVPLSKPTEATSEKTA
ncbi:Protein vip1 [Colletotrichum sp. SAR 10_70]|nr:Protein vip1 [Colletotrichum sp. SAR 10_71]KAI8180632.1 Protein vip1 [Colletotrichum sp. SAR 10_75]KAI8199884.1 Protein vip1 [Colletotrichum sp. SAR 10_70]